MESLKAEYLKEKSSYSSQSSMDAGGIHHHHQQQQQHQHQQQHIRRYDSDEDDDVLLLNFNSSVIGNLPPTPSPSSRVIQPPQAGSRGGGTATGLPLRAGGHHKSFGSSYHAGQLG
jgi:hypothetical protein